MAAARWSRSSKRGRRGLRSAEAAATAIPPAIHATGSARPDSYVFGTGSAAELAAAWLRALNGA